MTRAIVTEGQSLFDLALQECGHVSAAFGLATDNDLSLTAILTPGQVIEVAESRIVRPEVVAYYRARNHRINTDNSEVADAEPGIFDDSFDNSFN